VRLNLAPPGRANLCPASASGAVITLTSAVPVTFLGGTLIHLSGRLVGSRNRHRWQSNRSIAAGQQRGQVALVCQRSISCGARVPLSSCQSAKCPGDTDHRAFMAVLLSSSRNGFREV